MARAGLTWYSPLALRLALLVVTALCAGYPLGCSPAVQDLGDRTRTVEPASLQPAPEPPAERTEPAPAAVHVASGTVRGIAAAAFRTCAIVAEGKVKCWGRYEDYQKGKLFSPPIEVEGVRGAKEIGAGDGGHFCVITATDGLACWFEGYESERVDWFEDGIAALAIGSIHGCALTKVGGVKCWGKSWNGQLGNGTITEPGSWPSEPWDVTGLTSGVVQVAGSGSYFTCARTDRGKVFCWGDGTFGQMGDGKTGLDQAQSVKEGLTYPTPVEVPLEESAVAITASNWGACATLASGTSHCWGQIGSTVSPVPGPAPLKGLHQDLKAIALMQGEACALLTSGKVACWGGLTGISENGSIESAVPVEIAEIGREATSITAGVWHACALTKGVVRCWGNNEWSQLGSDPKVLSSSHARAVVVLDI